MTDHEPAVREIVELHRFFEHWFTGRVPGNERAFARVAGVLANDFEIVSPDGTRSDRAAILDAVRGAHGRYDAARFRIWIERVAARRLDEQRLLATYEEWHELEGARRGRLSSAVLQRDAEAPAGLVWRHLHETWLPAGR